VISGPATRALDTRSVTDSGGTLSVA